MQRNRHSPEFRDQARSKAADRGNRTLEAVALELNVSLGTLKGWPSDLAAAQWSAAQRLQAAPKSLGSSSAPALPAPATRGRLSQPLSVPRLTLGSRAHRFKGAATSVCCLAAGLLSELW